MGKGIVVLINLIKCLTLITEYYTQKCVDNNYIIIKPAIKIIYYFFYFSSYPKLQSLSNKVINNQPDNNVTC